MSSLELVNPLKGRILPNKYMMFYVNADSLESPSNWLIDMGEGYQTYQSIISRSQSLLVAYNNILSEFGQDTTPDIINNLLYAYYLYVLSQTQNPNDAIRLISQEIANIPQMIFHIDDMAGFISYMNNQYQKDLADTRTISSSIKTILDQLNDIDLSVYWEYVSKSTDKQSYVIKLALNSQPLNFNNGVHIFRDIVLSNRCPYVQYTNIDSERIFKVWKSSTLKPDYTKITNMRKKFIPGSIELTVWLGDGTLDNTQIDTFFHVIVDLTLSEIRYNVPSSRHNSRMIHVLTNVLGKIVALGEPKITKSTIGYTIRPLFNFLYEENRFLHFLILDPRFEAIRHIIYIDESITPYFRKAKYEFKYIAPYSDMFVDQLSPISWYFYMDVESQGTPLKFKIKNVGLADLDNIDNIFMTIVRVIILYYINYTDFTHYIDTIQNLEIVEKLRRENLTKFKHGTTDKTGIKSIGQGNTRESRFGRIAKKYPEIFNSDYKGQAKNQGIPEIFDSKEEAEEWSKTFPNGRRYEQYMSQRSIDNGEGKLYFWFGCPDEKYPYPNVVYNKNEVSAKKYPYLPVCWTTDRTSSKTSTTAYEYYYKGKAQIVRTRQNVLVGEMFLRPTESAVADPLIIDSLNIPGLTKLGIAPVKGNQVSPNSLIYCVLHALQLPGYLKAVSSYTTLDYVTRERQNIINTISVNVVKQECYDIDNTTITNNISNDQLFFDSYLYYRLIEEYYNINLYVFVLKNKKMTMEIPRHKIYSSRMARLDRRVVLLYKSHGPPSAILSFKYHGYELLVAPNNTYTFGSSTAETCHDIHTDIMSTLTFSIINDQVNTYANIYSSIDYQELFGILLESQYIDSYGKAYGFNLKTPSSTIFVHPVQPLNLPIADEPNKIDIAKALDFYITSDVSVSDTTRSNGMITGIWIKVAGMIYGIYIPVYPTTYPSLPYTGEAKVPYIKHGSASTNRFKTLSKYLSIIKQLVIWVYDVYGADVTSFVTKYTQQQSKEYDELDHYKLDVLGDILPKYNNADDCMIWLSRSNLTNGRVFTFHSARFQLQIIRFIQDYTHKTKGLVIEPRIIISGYYNEPKDFSKSSNDLVFMSRSDLDNWINEITKELKNEIVESITLQDSIRDNPKIYNSNDGHYWLIQSVDESTTNPIPRIVTDDMLDTRTPFYNALSVADTWRNHLVNNGYNGAADVRDVYENQALVYILNYKNKVIPSSIYDASQPQPRPLPDRLSFGTVLNVIEYKANNDPDGEMRYGAMLQLT